MDPFQLALEAAGLGTWDWDTSSGRVTWSPGTYRLFGLRPGALPVSHELFLRHVHADDRPAVVRWCEHALREGSRTFVEYRIVRADESIRWMRSTGRAIEEGSPKALHLAGVVDDVTEEKEARSAVAEPRADGLPTSFSARHLARMLGLGESTVKRMADVNEIESLRSSRKDSRRFAPEQVLHYLRRTSGTGDNFFSAARESDLRGCLRFLMEDLLAGAALDVLLDREIPRAAGVADEGFVAEFVARVPFLLQERRSVTFPALLAGDGERLAMQLARCLLQAHGYEVLRTAGGGSFGGVARIADSTRANPVVFFPPQGASMAGALAAAQDVARSPRAPAVAVWSGAPLGGSGGLVRVASAGDLASLLKRL